MHTTIATKIILGMILITLLGVVSLALTWHGLTTSQAALRQVINTEMPLSAAAYEMEINVIETGMGVLKYLETGEPHYRISVEQDQADLVRFTREYDRLASTPAAKYLKERLDHLYQEYVALGAALMRHKDMQEARFTLVSELFEHLDELLDEQIQRHIVLTEPDGPHKMLEAVEMETDIAEVGTWLGHYLSTARPAHRERIQDNAQDFREEVARFKALRLHPFERQRAQALETVFEQTMELIHDMLTQQAWQQEQVKHFFALRRVLDTLLDGEIQTLARRELAASSHQAEQAATAVPRRLLFLLPMFVGGCLLATVLLIRAIMRPVNTLRRGTIMIGAGQLAYRLPEHGHDEFTDLARQFNHMVAQLEATTVSKTLLEASTAELSRTNAALRQESTERQRAQVALFRSETMAALGALVAGVAHGVRTPLFGISATLDAFEARFGSHVDSQQYFPVLRQSLQRLNALMQALLDYSRPLNPTLTPGAVAPVLLQAIQVCAALAASAQVTFVQNIEPDLPQIRMEPERVLEVFQNLLENAVQHAPAGTTVEVAARQVHALGRLWVECSVADRGLGFATAELAQVFEPFFTRRQGGTGLGLSLAQRIVDTHAGEITAGNRAEGGAIMTVRFPGLTPDASTDPPTPAEEVATDADRPYRIG